MRVQRKMQTVSATSMDMNSKLRSTLSRPTESLKAGLPMNFWASTAPQVTKRLTCGVCLGRKEKRWNKYSLASYYLIHNEGSFLLIFDLMERDQNTTWLLTASKINVDSNSYSHLMMRTPGREVVNWHARCLYRGEWKLLEKFRLLKHTTVFPRK